MKSRRLGDIVASWSTDLLSRQPRPSASLFDRLRKLSIAVVLALLLTTAWAALAATTYIYDANGRLVAAVLDTGPSAQYVYDNMGNLTKIKRLAATDLAIFTFRPGRGGTGVEVTVIGQGFSATPAQNTVTFNGTAATVTSASATKLKALVPPGATTGRIAVKVGTVTALSQTNFIVDQNIRPPTISNISPTTASSGSLITITGQSMVPVANQTTAQLDSRSVFLASLTNTVATFTVPPGLGSGKVTVNTPYGTAISAQDVLVVPDGVLAGDIEQFKRVGVDAATQNFLVATNGHYAAALFVGSSQLLSAQFSAMTTSSIDYSLYDNNNQLLISGTMTASHPTFHMPRLSSSATHLLLMKPATGSASWGLSIETAKHLVADQAGVDVVTTVAGQSKRLSFNATAGQNLGLGISNLLTPGVGGDQNNAAYVAVVNFSGAQVGQQYCFALNNGCQLNLQNLAAGPYAVVIDPPVGGNGMMSFTATLSVDQTLAVATNVAVPLNLSLPGQNGRLTFSGTISQMISLHVSNQATTPAGRSVYYRVNAPDGGLLTSTAIVSTAGTLILPQLSQTGTYTIFIDPSYGETMTATVMVVADLVNQIVADGPPLDISTSVTGQRAYLDFTASAGAHLGMGLAQLIGSVPGPAYLEIHKSDGSYINGSTCSPEEDVYGCRADLPNLAGGSYRAIITPLNESSLMSFRAALSSEMTGTLQRDVPTNVSIVRNGQSAKLSFFATAGESLTLRFDQQVSNPTDAQVTYLVADPSGNGLIGDSSTGPVTLQTPSLPVTGSYTVSFGTDRAETLSLQALLTSGVTNMLVVDGATSSLATAIPGQAVVMTFTTSVTSNLGLGISELATPGTTDGIRFELRMADGTYVTEVSCVASNGGCQLNLPNLSSGSYRLEATPPTSSVTMSFKATLSTDISAALPLNTAYPVNLARPGQNAQLSFSGLAGSTLKLAVTGQTTTPSGGRVYYSVSGPNGYFATTSTLNAVEFSLPSFTQTGTYYLFVDPRYGETSSTQVAIGSGANITGSLSVDGSTNAYNTLFQAQQVTLTFVASAGANLGLGISDLVTPGTTGAANIQVNKPGGALYSNTTCRAANAGCGVNLPGLTAGTYTVIITPPTTGQKTLSFKATLSSDKLGSMTLGNAMTVSLARRGQDGRVTYAGTAGQKLSLVIASQTTTPSGGLAYYRVYRQDGTTQVVAGSTTSGTTITVPALPATETYTVLIDPQYGETLSSQITFQTR